MSAAEPDQSVDPAPANVAAGAPIGVPAGVQGSVAAGPAGEAPAAIPEQQPGLFQPPPRLFVCTPSKLGTYEDCPRRYRFTYLDRPSPPKGPPWAHNSLGASVHSALRAWFDQPRERRITEALSKLLRANWVHEGYRDGEQEREIFDRALGWLRRYILELTPGFEPIAVERTVAAKTASLALSGRVDRIDEVGDELVIVDYKTGRTGLDPDDARGSRALALYAFAVERVFRRRCRRVELHHLPSGGVAAHVHTDASLARHLRRAEQTAADAVSAERQAAAGADPDTAFPAVPGPLCGWCDFRTMCPVGSAQPAQEPWAALGLADDSSSSLPESDQNPSMPAYAPPPRSAAGSGAVRQYGQSPQ